MAGKILDNGMAVTLGLVGVVAAAGAVAKRGSAARTSRTASADFVERQLEKMDRLVEEITLNDAEDAVNDIERVMSAANFSGGFYDLPADLDDDAYALEQELEAARDEAQMLIDEEADEEAVLEKMENEVLPMIEKAIAQFRRAYAQEKRAHRTRR